MANEPKNRRRGSTAERGLNADIDFDADLHGAHDRPGQLLSVALTVDQLDGGEFHWVIIESFDHSMEFESLAASVIGYRTYIEALEAGFDVLKGMSPDPQVGPRDSDEIGDEIGDEGGDDR